MFYQRHYLMFFIYYLFFVLEKCFSNDENSINTISKSLQVNASDPGFSFNHGKYK